MNQEEVLTHTELGISAPVAYWRAISYPVSIVDGEHVIRPGGWEEMLIRGIHATDGTGTAVIAWALAERKRSGEEAERTRAIEKLADAMVSSERAEVLDSIMNLLTEKTRYAVQQQLKGRIL